MRPVKTLLLLCTALVPATLRAQNPPGLHDGATVSVRLADGSMIYGRLESRSADSVVILSAAGRMAFASADVRAVHNAGAEHTNDDGSREYWFPNANSTRLFFGPTGRTLDQGDGYFADHEVFLGSFAVGLTDRISIGGGGVMFPQANTWFITPKIGIVRSERVNIAAGALFGGVGDAGAGGIGYLAATLGGIDGNVTLGVGNAFRGSRGSRNQVVMLGGETRVSRRVSLVTENYVFPGSSQPLISYGLRILGEKTSVDLAFINTIGSGTVFPGWPFVDFVVRF